MKVSAYRSDISGTLIEDEAELAKIRVTYPANKRRSVRVIDATAAEADELLAGYGKTVQAPGRKPAE